MGRTGNSLNYNPPTNVGEEALSLRGSHCREKTGWPLDKMVVVVVAVVVVVVAAAAVVVVEYYYYLKNNYC